jgi:hypothetical protein
MVDTGSSEMTLNRNLLRCSFGTALSPDPGVGCMGCPAGTYFSGGAQGSCTPCPMGRYAAQAGQTQCTGCSPGKYGVGAPGQVRRGRVHWPALGPARPGVSARGSASMMPEHDLADRPASLSHLLCRPPKLGRAGPATLAPTPLCLHQSLARCARWGSSGPRWVPTPRQRAVLDCAPLGATVGSTSPARCSVACWHASP